MKIIFKICFINHETDLVENIKDISSQQLHHEGLFGQFPIIMTISKWSTWQLTLLSLHILTFDSEESEIWWRDRARGRERKQGRKACQRNNTAALVSSKLTGWQTCLSELCQYSLGPLVMGHTPNDRNRSFPPAVHINPQSGPCPNAETAEHTLALNTHVRTRHTQT